MSVLPPLVRTAAVARETVRQTLRERSAAVLVCLASLATIGSVFLAPLALGEVTRVVVDVGLALALLAALAVMVASGTMLFAQELSKRSLLPVLATPVRRSEIVLGRALGLWAAGVFVVAALTVVHFATLAMLTHRAWWTVLPANLLTVGELTVVVAWLALFSAFSTPGLTATLTLVLFGIGHGASDLLAAADRLPAATAWGVRVLYGVVPHLEVFDGRAAVVHGHALGLTRIEIAAGYAIAYTAAILIAACLAFRRREIA